MIESPNYTQAPNVLFDELMKDMTVAELKVLMAICRLTFGFHRKKARASLTKVSEMTGLARQSVLTGAEKLEEKDLIKRTQDGGVTEWVVQILDRSSPNLRPPSIKESKKEKDSSTEEQADAPVQTSDYVSAMEVLEKAFFLARGIPWSKWKDWWTNDPKMMNKRFRLPLARVWRKWDKSTNEIAIAIKVVVSGMLNDGLTFDAPDGIEKTLNACLMKAPPKRRKRYVGE